MSTWCEKLDRNPVGIIVMANYICMYLRMWTKNIYLKNI